MKRWTVMLIPQGQGNTQTLNLHSAQLYSLISVFVLLAFLSAFFVQRSLALNGLVNRLQQENRELEHAGRQQPVAGEADTGLSEVEREAIASEFREEYDRSMAAIVAELDELYSLENQLRRVQGLGPRPNTASAYTTPAMGGKGGPMDDAGVVGSSSPGQLIAAPHVIIGLRRPSADLILQEIQVRKASIEQLLQDAEANQDVRQRTPSRTPLTTSKSRITSEFGVRRDPWTRKLRQHSGTDFAAPYGSTVVATGRGVVIESGWDGGGLGNVVRIDHGDGIVTVYGHLSRCVAKVGAEVNRGEEIGKLGSTGRSTGPHVHYEVHVNGAAVNPERYF